MLTPSGRKTVLAALERRLEQLVVHPAFGYQVSNSRLFELQARLLRVAVLGEADGYRASTTRRIMSQRHRRLVGYDIADAKRLRRMHRLLSGYGDAVQYSVFACDLTLSERQVLREQIAQRMHERDDRVMFVDLGPVGRGHVVIEFVGRSLPSILERYGATIV
jgi:CRISPR-associated protein Cas2